MIVTLCCSKDVRSVTVLRQAKTAKAPVLMVYSAANRVQFPALATVTPTRRPALHGMRTLWYTLASLNVCCC
jgi:hypothetical protein